jgi:catechol 2,3-dioxygenase-like lactoylglutathione lyase family enzyme
MAHLRLTAIIVEDYDEAIAFFTEALGFELVEDSPATTDDGRAKRWVVVRPAGAETGILLARADGDHQVAAIGNQHAGRVGFFLHVVFRDIAGNRWDLLGPAA